jgi:Ca2+-binding RTX toxin-like protein
MAPRSISHRSIRGVGATLAVSLLGLSAPAAAQAASVALAGDTLTYRAAALEGNEVTFEISGPNYLVIDTGVTAIADGDGTGGCTVTGNEASCPAAGVMTVDVATDDLVDIVTIGGATNDLVDGGAGSDVLEVGAGHDTVLGGDGNDDLHGGDGNDAMRGGAGADIYFGGAGTGDLASYSDSTEGEIVIVNDVADDGSADDGPTGARDNVRTDVERFRGGAGNDRYTGSAIGNLIEGLGGGDTLIGGDGNDVLHGGDGNDALRGQTGADAYNGGPGTDLASYADSFEGEVVLIDDLPNDGSPDDGPVGARDNVKTDIEHVRGGPAADRLFGGGGDERLEGADNKDMLFGSPGDDVLDGGPGDDWIEASASVDGADVFIGGEGNIDLLRYTKRTSGRVTISLDGVANDGQVLGPASTEGDNVGDGFEQYYGLPALSGNPAEGNDFTGSPARDVFWGGNGRDVLRGLGGDDQLFGYGGPDVLDGADGTDVLYGNADDDRLFGGPAGDFLEGFEGDDLLLGGPGNDQENGGSGADVLDQQAGANGADTLNCGADSVDRVEYDARTDAVVVRLDSVANDGRDGNGDGQGEEQDKVFHTCEEVVGGSGPDILVGGQASETLSGMRGNDLIVGGWAPDNLNGGAGDDRLSAKDGFADSVRAGNSEEVAGDSGNWDAGLDLVSGMEDTNPN